MKTLDTIAGKTYVVTSPNGCTVTDETGLTLGTVDAGQQKVFVATGAKMQTDDDSARITATFSAAPTIGSGSGGGPTIQFDTTVTKNSTNAVTSGGLYNILKAGSPAIGLDASAGSYSVAMGRNAGAHSNATAYGYFAQAEKNNAIAVGGHAKATAFGGTVIGHSTTLNDPSTAVFSVATQTDVIQTLLYIIGAGSSLASTYENGEACLGYVVKDKSGNILACGTRKLSELLTNNTAFAPAALDLDAPAPTPFLPTGIMEPIEIDTPEDLTV